MKMFLAFASLLLCCLTAGCQQMTPIPVVTAPPVTDVAYSQVNASTPVTVANYTDQPATGVFCYFVQMLDGTGVSGASNTSCATTTIALKHIALSWNVPASYVCQNAPCKFVVSRAPAVLTPVGVPTLSVPTNTAVIVGLTPVGVPTEKTLALLDLKIRVRE